MFCIKAIVLMTLDYGAVCKGSGYCRQPHCPADAQFSEKRIEKRSAVRGYFLLPGPVCAQMQDEGAADRQKNHQGGRLFHGISGLL